jgi:hypothetical protein
MARHPDAGSCKGAETAAILFSVTSSCHRNKVDAFAYLRDLLQRLTHDPQPAPEVLRDWLPDRWKPPPAEPATTRRPPVPQSVPSPRFPHPRRV